MGTHSYALEAKIVNKSFNEDITKEFAFDLTSLNSTSCVDDLYESEMDEPPIFSEDYECREVMSEELTDTILSAREEKSRVLLGIRCSGEMYTKVAKPITRNNVELVEKVLEKIFKFPFKIVVSKQNLDNNCQYNFSSSGILEIDGLTKPVDKFIDLFFDTKTLKNSDDVSVAILAILALFKEIRIISKVISGEINSLNSLITELVNICRDRYLGEDFSYDCWRLEDSTNEWHIKKALASSFNTDGSDFMSILLLALFILGFNKGIVDFELENGPVNAVMNSGEVSYLLGKLPPATNLNFLIGYTAQVDSGVEDEILEYIMSKK